VVSAEPADLQGAERAEVAGAARAPERGAAQRLRFAVFALAGRLLTHAGRLVLRISEEAERLAGLVAARTRLGALHLRIASG
jgi:hypothetical protein